MTNYSDLVSQLELETPHHHDAYAKSFLSNAQVTCFKSVMKYRATKYDKKHLELKFNEGTLCINGDNVHAITDMIIVIDCSKSTDDSINFINSLINKISMHVGKHNNTVFNFSGDDVYKILLSKPAVLNKIIEMYKTLKKLIIPVDELIHFGHHGLYISASFGDTHFSVETNLNSDITFYADSYILSSSEFNRYSRGSSDYSVICHHIESYSFDKETDHKIKYNIKCPVNRISIVSNKPISIHLNKMSNSDSTAFVPDNNVHSLFKNGMNIRSDGKYRYTLSRLLPFMDVENIDIKHDIPAFSGFLYKYPNDNFEFSIYEDFSSEKSDSNLEIDIVYHYHNFIRGTSSDRSNNTSFLL